MKDIHALAQEAKRVSSGGSQWSVKLRVSSKGENTELDIEKRTIRVCRCASCVGRCAQKSNCGGGRKGRAMSLVDSVSILFRSHIYV